MERWSEERLRAELAESGFEPSEVWPVFERWFIRGDGVAIYANHDLGHPEVGHKQYVSYGSSAAQLEVSVPPQQLPDIGNVINWRYTLVAIYDGYDDGQCPGHESLDAAHMGESVYCDGSCLR